MKDISIILAGMVIIICCALRHQIIIMDKQVKDLEVESKQSQIIVPNNRAEDLAMYYEQHKTATPAVKETIGELVVIKFKSFDKEQLVNGALKQFLVNQRVRFWEVK